MPYADHGCPTSDKVGANSPQPELGRSQHRNDRKHSSIARINPQIQRSLLEATACGVEKRDHHWSTTDHQAPRHGLWRTAKLPPRASLSTPPNRVREMRPPTPDRSGFKRQSTRRRRATSTKQEEETTSPLLYNRRLCMAGGSALPGKLENWHAPGAHTLGVHTPSTDSSSDRQKGRSAVDA